jgi:predicted 3-demethylubiquinone-9 3-methyltransferase (glyoxalase superfamily)
MKQRITSHLWFDKEASDAAEFYASVFKDSKIKGTTTIYNTPSGDTDIINIELSGQEFTLISAGPLFKFNPSISFLVACKTEEEVDALWNEFSKEGKVLMEIGTYPFSEKYGWIQDKYGLSWQLMFFGSREFKQKIVPTLMFAGKVVGKAEEAINFYVSVFHNSAIGDILRSGKDEDLDAEGTIKHVSFELEGQEFAAMDSAREHNFAFNEAISLIVHCETQEEVDYYWERLSADPKAEVCGWLKDKYGVSWQVIPNILQDLLNDKDEKKKAQVTEAFLRMKKLNIETLKKAYSG